MAVSKKTTVAGNAGTETVVGAAVAQMKKASLELTGAFQSVNGLAEKAEELQMKVAQSEQRIVELQGEYAEKKREADVELALAIKKDKDAFVMAWLDSEDSVAVKEAELEDYKSQIAALKSENQKEIDKAVSAACGALKKTYDADKALLESQHQTKSAEDKAKITNLENQVKFINDQAQEWKRQLDAEREAGIKRAQAGAIGTISVGGGSEGSSRR